MVMMMIVTVIMRVIVMMEIIMEVMIIRLIRLIGNAVINILIMIANDNLGNDDNNV